MGQFDGKKGLILGVANDRSIAWAIAEFIMREGGQCGFTHLPDAPDDPKRKNRRRVAQCTEGHERAKFLVPLDVRDDSNIAAVMEQICRRVREDRFSAALDCLRGSRGFETRHGRDEPGRIQAGHGDQRVQPDCRGQRGQGHHE